ncbi:MAG: hypothetical protein WC494_00040 [Candidatus Pacearchaeota archaeon]
MIGNKKALVKISLVTFAVLFLVAFMFLVVSVGADDVPTITTDKEDYAPEETVVISGEGFGEYDEVLVKVTRPDNSVVSGDGTFEAWPKDYDYVTIDSGGKFEFNYILDGVEGEYEIKILDTDEEEVLATGSFTDNVVDLVLTYPNGGEVVSGTIDITFDVQNNGQSPLGVVYVKYSSSGCSGSWTDIGSVDSPLTGSHSVQWDTTGVSDGSNYCIKIIDGAGDDWDTSNCPFTIDNPVCGDGNIDEGEECDDGNTNNGDGCSFSCQDTTCPFKAQSGRTIVDFSESLLSNGNINDAQTGLKSVSLLGYYDVSLYAYDGNSGRAGQNQAYEQYKVLFFNSTGYNIVNSSASDDLADNVLFADWSGEVDDSLLILNANGVKGFHTYLSAPSGNPNSVYAGCVAFDKVDDVECEEDSDCSYFEDSCHTASCVNYQCEQEFYDVTGPVVSDLVVNPALTNSLSNISAYAEDLCSNIKNASYYVDNYCQTEKGSLNALDGAFDEKMEDLIKYGADFSSFADGKHDVYVMAWDEEGNPSNCAYVSIDIDKVAPDNPRCDSCAGEFGMSLNGECNIAELLVCGNNPSLTAYISDAESRLQAAEYFIDNFNQPNWFGFNMGAVDGAFDEQCEEVIAEVNMTNLSEGTHYIKLHGKDRAENWGKFSGFDAVSFIKDTTAPKTKKTLNLVDGASVVCSGQEYILPGKVSLTDGCAYVKQGTSITLEARDFNPDDSTDQIGLGEGYNNLTGEYAGDVTTKYKVWFSEDCNCEWEEGDEMVYEGPIVLNEDSCHLIEYWSVDGVCGNEETHHFELDIVDTKAPITTKVVGEPKVEGEEGIHYYITSGTQINLTCVDPQPHPVNDVTLYWNVSWKYECDSEEPWTPLGQYSSDGNATIVDLNDSCHKIEYYCVDALGNAEELETEIDAVDNQAPVIDKEIVGPWSGYCGEMTTSGDFSTMSVKDCYIDGITNISVSVTDPQPHPVDDVTCSWSYRITDQCEPVTIVGGQNLGSPFIVHFPEESVHELTIVCEDALGNLVTDVDTFIVDKTKPTTTLTYGTPYVNKGGVEWINGSTSITLSAVDNLPHPSGIKETRYRFGLVDDSFCYGTNETEFREGLSGDWNTSTPFVPFVIPDDSCHAIEYYSVDNVNKIENVNVKFVFVDNKAPSTNKVLGEPKMLCEDGDEKCGPKGQWSAYYVNSSTNITLSCADQNPHPVESEKICYKIEGPGYEQSDWICETLNSSKEFTFNYHTDSLHKVEWYCEDGLGNVGETQVEYDNVDNVGPYISIVKPEEESNVSECSQKVLIQVIDKKSGVNESSIRAVLISDSGEGVVVKNITLGKVVYEDEGEVTVTYEEIMDKSLPSGWYQLVVYASDNLGNQGNETLNEYLSESLMVQYINPANCKIIPGEPKECEFEFNVCMRGGNSIKFWMDEVGGLFTPGKMNASISSGNYSKDVGLFEKTNKTEQNCMEEIEKGFDYVWEEGICWFKTVAGTLPLSCEEINGKAQFNLTLSMSGNMTDELGSINKIDYFMESITDESSPLCEDIQED